MSFGPTPLPERRFVLHGISWNTYETLLKDLEHGSVRLTYDRGSLELMSPSRDHERFKTLIGRMIELFTEELDIPMQSGGMGVVYRPRHLQRQTRQTKANKGKQRQTKANRRTKANKDIHLFLGSRQR